MDRSPIRLHVELLPEGVYLATSPDVPGLVVQAETIDEAVEFSKDVALAIRDTCIENGFPVPPALQRPAATNAMDLIIPIEAV